MSWPLPVAAAERCPRSSGVQRRVRGLRRIAAPVREEGGRAGRLARLAALGRTGRSRGHAQATSDRRRRTSRHCTVEADRPAAKCAAIAYRVPVELRLAALRPLNVVNAALRHAFWPSGDCERASHARRRSPCGGRAQREEGARGRALPGHHHIGPGRRRAPSCPRPRIWPRASSQLRWR